MKGVVPEGSNIRLVLRVQETVRIIGYPTFIAMPCCWKLDSLIVAPLIGKWPLCRFFQPVLAWKIPSSIAVRTDTRTDSGPRLKCGLRGTACQNIREPLVSEHATYIHVY